MHPITKSHRLFSLAAGAFMLALPALASAQQANGSAQQAQAGELENSVTPKTFWACYVQGSGTVYRIREAGLRDACSNANHIMFSWTEGDGPSGSGQGPVGPQGPAGPQGEKGEKGDPGEQGPAGPEGPAGPQGPAGSGGSIEDVPAAGDLSGTYPAPIVARLQGRNVENTTPTSGQVLAWNGSAWAPSSSAGGEKGEKGDTGEQGPAGPEGPAGPAGPQGEKGEKGDPGDPGPAGSIENAAAAGDLAGNYPAPIVARLQGRNVANTAPTSGQVLAWNGSAWAPSSSAGGEKGEKGDTGEPGPEGPQGPEGPAGAQGPEGPAGPQGSQGEPGPAGPTGPQGEKGEKGDPGEPGPAGSIEGAAAAGDLSGSYPAPLVVKLQGRTVANTAPAAGQLLGWNAASSVWEPTTAPAGGSVGPDLDLPGTLNVGGVSTFGSAIGNWNSPSIDVRGSALVTGYLRANAGVRIGHDANNVHQLIWARSGSAPTDRFVADSAGGIWAFGELGRGYMYAQGAGERMFWYPFKAAFRAGQASATSWNDANTGFYSWAGGMHTVASGNGSFATGFETQANGLGSVATGLQTVASGEYSLAGGQQTTASGNRALATGQSTTASGSNAVAMGESSTASGANAVAIGTSVTASGARSTAMGRRVSTNNRTGSFIYGDDVASVNALNSRDNQFAVRAQHLWFGTTSNVTNPTGHFITTSTGAHLTTGGVWQNSSDVNRKHLFEQVDVEQVLRSASALPVRTWGYREEDASVRHMGAMAQDFHAAFGLGNSDTSIGTVDMDGVLLASVQALEARTRAQDARITALEKQVAELLAELSRR